MRDVAALARVSVTTVSRVINDEPGVTAQLAVRVRAAIEQLNYRHNLTASSLRRADGRGGTIGVVLEYIADPFDSLLHRAIEEYALTRGVLVLAGSLEEDEVRERELIAALAARRVDGLVIMPAGHDQSYLLNERRSGTPMVFVDRPPGFFDADDVLTDNLDGARRGVRHLLRKDIGGSATSATCRPSAPPRFGTRATAKSSPPTGLPSMSASSEPMCGAASGPRPPPTRSCRSRPRPRRYSPGRAC